MRKSALQDWRERRGFSIMALANRSGVAVKTIKDAEKFHQPNAFDRFRLGQALNIPAFQLFPQKETVSPAPQTR